MTIQQQMTIQDQEADFTVSIIIPVKNGEKTLATLLESLAQIDYDREKLQFLVIDGKSTDKTIDIVKRYPFVQLITQNGDGLNAARNSGVRNSKSEIIAFTDSDCVVTRDWVKSIVENFSDPEIGCIGGSTKGFNGDTISNYADNSVMPVLRIFKRREILDSIKLLQRFPAGCNMAFRHEALEEIGGFDENIKYGFDEDDAAERVCKAGYKMVLDPNCLILHKHRSSLRELLGQTFGYGRGIGLILKKKGLRNAVSKWAFLNFLGFFTWIFSVGVLVSSLITSSFSPLLTIPLMIVTAPFLVPAIIYAQRAIKDGRPERIVIYPSIDILRIVTFAIGEIYQLFKIER